MPQPWKRPGLPLRAIIALVAALLLALQGGSGASPGYASGGERQTLSQMASFHAASFHVAGALCVADGEEGGVPTAPHPSHCPKDCCQIVRAPAVVALFEAPALTFRSASRVGANGPSAPAPSPRASGWETSWSSQAPPRS